MTDPFAIGRHRRPASPKARRIVAAGCLSLSVLAPVVVYNLPGSPKAAPAQIVQAPATPGPASPTPTATKATAVSSPARTIALARKQVGISGRPNTFTRWYAQRYGSVYSSAEWCSIFLAWLAGHSGLSVPMNALASAQAENFRLRGQFSRTPRVGDFAFFDWAGGRLLSGIDHSALVVAVKPGAVTVIEGNSGNAVRLRTRSTANVVGFGHPKYAAKP